MLKSFNIKKDDKVKRQIKAFIEQGRSEEETDKEIIKYNDWLNMLIWRRKISLNLYLVASKLALPLHSDSGVLIWVNVKGAS